MEPTVDNAMNAASAIDTANVGHSVEKFSLSLWDLFWGADWLVQLVMFMLLAASFWSWTIIIAKVQRLRLINQQASQFEDVFWSGTSLDQLYENLSKRQTSPLSSVFVAAMKEWKRKPAGKSTSTVGKFSAQERIQRIMNVTINREMEDLEKYMIFLASVGSTAPFVGLFGTVWGIMDSFQGIAASQSTNLAVVAPGIAEALFATAIGLIAAIPAVLAYNKLSTEINRFGARMEAFSEEFITLLSRQVEEAA